MSPKQVIYEDLSQSVEIISPMDISNGMTGDLSVNLNTLSHEKIIQLILRAILHYKGKLIPVFVDTIVSKSILYSILNNYFPLVHIVLSQKEVIENDLVVTDSICCYQGN